MVASTMPRRLSRQAKVDWVLYGLLLIAVLCLPMVIQDTHWFPEAQRLLGGALLGAALGVLVAHSPLPGWLAWALAVGLGLEYSVQFTTKLLPSLALVLGDLAQYVSWSWDLLVRRTVGVLPASRSLEHSIAQFHNTVASFGQWTAALQIGGESKDITALKLGVALLVWLLCWNAAYQLIRKKSAFAALLPIGVAIVGNVSYTDIGMSYVHVFLAVTLLALVRANISRLEAIWGRLNLDFSPELRRDTTVAGGGAAVLILVVALLMPYMTYNKAVWLFWDRYGPSFKSFYEQLDRAFAGRNPVPEPTPGGPGGIDGHSLRTTGTLGEDVVLIVETSDPIPPPDEELEMILDVEGINQDMLVPRHYWRQRTYDLYTGHGWESSNREDQVLGAGQAWRAASYPYSVLTQTFRMIRSPIGSTSVLGYAVNEPVRVESDYRVYTRGESDMAAFSLGPLDSAEPSYTVISWVPDVYEDSLQSASGEYPEWVSERYLQLPDTLPDRVKESAAQIVREAGATTRHEMAAAIERSIRALEYDLDLEPPPLDADVVDYFLFDAKRGYCDYSATAMAVMLRSVGVAARYASGYHMGSYDYNESGWVVRESNAHAWTEVYYPGLGWIEYEPTPSQRVFYRPPSPSSYEGLLGARTALQATGQRVPLWVWAAGLGIILLFVVVWPPRWIRRRRRSPRERVWSTYASLVRRARWAGLGPVPGQTPHEYLSALARHVGAVNSDGSQATEDIALIERVYLRARYSLLDVTDEEGDRVEGAWRRLRGALTRLIFAGSRRRGATRARAASTA